MTVDNKHSGTGSKPQFSHAPSPRDPMRGAFGAWVTPVLLLCVAYALLGLTFTKPHSHGDLMQRCVLMNPNLARIWSVSNIEIGLSYFGVFSGMVFYFLRLYRKSRQHLIDLELALGYLAFSFLLDYLCVLHFEPFVAMLIGDAVIMTFTLIVSRQLWFQRLLGIFVPLVFLTCSLGHFMEGLSYWHLTYPLNTPWMMVTADIGFAILVNSARFPGLIRGEDVLEELAVQKQRNEALEKEMAARAHVEAQLHQSEQQRLGETRRRETFARNVMLAMSGGRLHLHVDASKLPGPLPIVEFSAPLLSRTTLGRVRRQIDATAVRLGFPDARRHDLVSAAGEALMNAVVHASGGSVVLSREHRDGNDFLQVRVQDAGAGMDWETLPYATLQSGWSSKGTLGMGFTVMASADTVDILTGPEGTTIILTVARTESGESHFAFASSSSASLADARPSEFSPNATETGASGSLDDSASALPSTTGNSGL